MVLVADIETVKSNTLIAWVRDTWLQQVPNSLLAFVVKSILDVYNSVSWNQMRIAFAKNVIVIALS